MKRGLALANEQLGRTTSIPNNSTQFYHAYPLADVSGIVLTTPSPAAHNSNDSFNCDLTVDGLLPHVLLELVTTNAISTIYLAPSPRVELVIPHMGDDGGRWVHRWSSQAIRTDIRCRNEELIPKTSYATKKSSFPYFFCKQCISRVALCYVEIVFPTGGGLDLRHFDGDNYDGSRIIYVNSEE